MYYQQYNPFKLAKSISPFNTAPLMVKVAPAEHGICPKIGPHEIVVHQGEPEGQPTIIMSIDWVGCQAAVD